MKVWTLIENTTTHEDLACEHGLSLYIEAAGLRILFDAGQTGAFADNARHLKYKDGRESWEAFGNVVVKNLMNQETMETDTLYWDQKNERIYTHCYVRMYSPDGFAQGYGMESDQRARDTELFNPFNNYAIMSQDSTKVVIDSVNFIGPLQKK
jgi:hypothetical protein